MVKLTVVPVIPLALSEAMKTATLAVDISFNAVGIPDTEILGVPLVELDVEQFSMPITTYATSYFLTARLAAGHMIPNKSGGDHDRHRTPVAEGHPIERRLRCGDGRVSAENFVRGLPGSERLRMLFHARARIPNRAEFGKGS
jgi:hypothetical protein